MTSSYKRRLHSGILNFKPSKPKFLCSTTQKRLWGQAVVMCLLVRRPTQGNIHNQLGQCINKGKLFPLPLYRDRVQNRKRFFFSSSMCYLAIWLELLWIFQIKQALPIVRNLVWAPLKNCTWSEAFKVRRDNFMLYFNGWFSVTILWLVFSGRNYISEHVSICLLQKSLPGVRTIFET